MDIDTSVLMKNKMLMLLSLVLVLMVVGGGWFLSGKVFEAMDAMSSISNREDELKSLTEKILKLDGIDEETYRKRNEEMLVKVLPEKVDLSLALGGLVTIIRDGNFE